MGLLRIYLALCVVAAHAGQPILPWPVHSSVEAVQIFFLISGFYMSLITTKYKAAIEFYISRFLRIFFPYYVILGGAVVLMIISGLTFGNWLDLTPFITSPLKQNGLPGVILASLTNFTLLFQDWFMFLKNDPGQALSFTAHFTRDANPLYNYLLIRQAWSIGTELTFYIFVPALGKLKTRWLVLIAFVSLASRVYAYQVLGLTNDPFSYRFFPFELLLFVSGMIMQRAYAATLAKWPRFKLQNLIQYLVFAAGLIFFFYLAQKVPGALHNRFGVAKPYTLLISYAGWAFVIPFFYHLTRDIKVDRFIGELSYPVYLTHLVIVEFATLALRALSIQKVWLGVVSAVITLVVSALLFVYIFRPFEEKRRNLAHDLAVRWTGPGKTLAEENPSPSSPAQG